MRSRKQRDCQAQPNGTRYGQGSCPSTPATSVESAVAACSLIFNLRSRELPVMQQNLAKGSYLIGQQITQAMLTQTPQDALLTVARVLGEAFLAESCLIVPFPQQASVAYWSLESGMQQMQDAPEPTAAILRHLLEQNGTSKSAKQPIVISDLPLTLANHSDSDSPATICHNPLHPTDRLLETVSSANNSLPSSDSYSVIAIQTLFQKQINGVIVLTGSRPNQWRELEVHLLKTLAPQVAVAISHSQLEQRVQQQQQQQILLDQLTSTIRNSGSLQQVFQLAIEAIPTTLQASRGMVLLFKYSDPLFKQRSQGLPKAKASIAAQWCDRAEFIDSELEPESEAFWIASCELCRHLLSNPTDPVIVRSDAARDTLNPVHLSESVDLFAASQDTASLFQFDDFATSLIMPLENQGTILGCLVLQHERMRSCSSAEITFVRMVAAQLSTAIIQNRTLQQVQAMVQERTAQLQRSLEVQAKLYEKTRQQVEQLQRLNGEREEFLSTVSHELLTPLTSMTLAIRMLRQSSLPPERQAKYLDILEQQCAQETTLINDLLALRQLEANQADLELEKLDVRHWIQDLAGSIAATWTENDVQLEIEVPQKPLLIQTDSESLNRVLTELLTNAKKYSEPGSLIHLQVSHQPDRAQGSVMVRLSNTGAGISPEELPHIFDKFRRGQGVTQQAIQGTGLGLALVKGLVEHLNGEITASSHPIGQSSLWQTCFTLVFPQCLQGTVQLIS